MEWRRGNWRPRLWQSLAATDENDLILRKSSFKISVQIFSGGLGRPLQDSSMGIGVLSIAFLVCFALSILRRQKIYGAFSPGQSIPPSVMRRYAKVPAATRLPARSPREFPLCRPARPESSDTSLSIMSLAPIRDARMHGVRFHAANRVGSATSVTTRPSSAQL